MPRREPEAEHRRGEERRDNQLGAQAEGAEERRGLGALVRRHQAGELLAPGADQQPCAQAGEREHRRPAQEAVLAVDEERREAVAAREVAAREVGVGRGLARDVGRVGRRAAVERLVHAHVEDHAE